MILAPCSCFFSFCLRLQKRGREGSVRLVSSQSGHASHERVIHDRVQGSGKEVGKKGEQGDPRELREGREDSFPWTRTSERPGRTLCRPKGRILSHNHSFARLRSVSSPQFLHCFVLLFSVFFSFTSSSSFPSPDYVPSFFCPAAPCTTISLPLSLSPSPSLASCVMII